MEYKLCRNLYKLSNSLAMSSAAAATIRILPFITLIIVMGVTCPVLISGGDDKYEIGIRVLATVVVLSAIYLLRTAKHNRDMAADNITTSLSLENSMIQIQHREGIEFEMASYKDGNHNICILPEDLLVEIFLRSSVKCLLRAKCVCKYWYGLIKDPSFAYKHLNFQKQMKKDRRLLVQHSPQETLSYSYTIVDGIPQSNTTTCHVRDCLKVSGCGLFMYGPVNGLYCLFNGYDRFVLWNPALMDFKTLPLPPSHIFPHYTVDCNSVGFGVDPLTNDYKVVLIRGFSDTTDFYEQVGDRLTTIYSLSTNTWRLLDLGICRPYPFSSSSNNSFLSGTHYWGSGEYDVVLTFHMSKETFGVIPGPPDDPQCDRQKACTFHFTVYEDRLALLQHYTKTYTLIHIWVMLEEGMWIKQFSIQPTPGDSWPLGFFGNNKCPFLVLKVFDGDYDNPVRGGQVVLYNCITQKISSFGPKGASRSFAACIYQESLVPVNGGNKCKGILDQFKMVSAFLSRDPSS